jgi:hypothetical protein
MVNQREKLRRDEVIREITREAGICGKDDQKTFCAGFVIVGHFTEAVDNNDRQKSR